MTEPAWLESEMPILDYEAQVGWPSARKQRLFAVACCRRLLPLLAPAQWPQCVSVAEHYADRCAKREELAAVCPRVLREMARSATYAEVVKETAEIAMSWLCETRKRLYAGQVASYAYSAFAYAALPPNEPDVPPSGTQRYAQAWADAAAVERKAQVRLLDEVCANQYRPVAFDPAWRTSDAVALARSMYDSRDFSAMPILADALQDAGCEDEQVLNHCRDANPVHVRGCWVCDLVLGRA